MNLYIVIILLIQSHFELEVQAKSHHTHTDHCNKYEEYEILDPFIIEKLETGSEEIIYPKSYMVNNYGKIIYTGKKRKLSNYDKRWHANDKVTRHHEVDFTSQEHFKESDDHRDYDDYVRQHPKQYEYRKEYKRQNHADESSDIEERGLRVRLHRRPAHCCQEYSKRKYSNPGNNHFKLNSQKSYDIPRVRFESNDIDKKNTKISSHEKNSNEDPIIEPVRNEKSSVRRDIEEIMRE